MMRHSATRRFCGRRPVPRRTIRTELLTPVNPDSRPSSGASVAPRGTSFWDTLSRRLQAWSIRRQGTDELSLLHLRQHLSEARLGTEAAETRLQVHRQVRSLPLAVARTTAAQEVELRHLLWEIDRDPGERRRETIDREKSETASLSSPPTGDLSWKIDHKQIAREALEAVVRFRDLTPSEADSAWEQWRTGLALRYPTLVVQEIIRCANELRDLRR